MLLGLIINEHELEATEVLGSPALTAIPTLYILIHLLLSSR